MSIGVEARALLHAGTSKSRCLIVGANIEVFFETMQYVSDYTGNQIQSALASLVNKGEFVVNHDVARQTSEFRLTDAGERHVRRILSSPQTGPTRLWMLAG